MFPTVQTLKFHNIVGGPFNKLIIGGKKVAFWLLVILIVCWTCLKLYNENKNVFLIFFILKPWNQDMLSAKNLTRSVAG